MQLSSTLYFFFLILFLACTVESDLQVPFKGKELVLIGILNPDSSIKTNLTYSQPANSSTKPEIVDNATVKLFENGTFLQGLEYQSNGDYVSTITPVPGFSYKVTVEVPGFSMLEAEDIIPGDPLGNSCFELRKNVTIDTYNVSINIDLENKGNETNVYWIDVLAKDYVGRDTAETSLTKLGPLESNSIMLDNFNALYDNSFYVFQYTLYVRQSDESKKLDSFQTNIVGGGGHPFFRYKTLTRLDENQALIVNIYNCSSAYDKYLKSILLEFLSNNSFDMPNPLNGPVKIYSNVKNGHGIFASYNIQSQILNNAECI